MGCNSFFLVGLLDCACGSVQIEPSEELGAMVLPLNGDWC